MGVRDGVGSLQRLAPLLGNGKVVTGVSPKEVSRMPQFP